MKRIIDFFKGLPIYVFVIIAFLGFVFIVTSCQGLFNVNVKDSNSNVVLNDSLKLGGESETSKKSL